MSAELDAARRRRFAALRLVPLESGKRDPLGFDSDAPASTPAIVEGLRALWRLADPADRPVVERIARRVQELGL
jgi:hypothetical protein